VKDVETKPLLAAGQSETKQKRVGGLPNCFPNVVETMGGKKGT